MKKKFIALTLCLLLCIPLVLTSCFTKDPPPQDDDPIPELSTYELLGGKFVAEKNPRGFTSIIIEGENPTYNGVFVKTESSETSADLVITTTYRVYNLEVGAEIYSTSVIYDYKTLDYQTNYTDVIIDLFNDFFVVTKYTDEDVAVCELYAQNGQLLLEADEEVMYYHMPFGIFDTTTKVVFDDAIYEIQKTDTGYTTSLVFDLEFMPSISSMPISIGDKYYLVSDDETTLYIFNSSYSQTHEITLIDDSCVAFSDYFSNVFPLNNGNILVQNSFLIGSFSDVNSVDYDFVSQDECYRIETYIINTSTGEKTAVETPYTFETVISRSMIELLMPMLFGKDFELPFEFENIATGVYKIENKELIPVNENAYITTINNDLSISAEYCLPNDAQQGQIISEGKYILSGAYYTRLYNQDDTLVKELGNIDYNEKFIITSKAIYDHDMKLVYSLKDNDADIEEITSNSIIISTYDKTNNQTVYSLIFNNSEAPLEIFRQKSGNEINISSDHYYIKEILENEDGEEYQLVSFYTTEGTLITSVNCLPYTSVIRNSYHGNGYYRYSLTTEDGTCVIILK